MPTLVMWTGPGPDDSVDQGAWIDALPEAEREDFRLTIETWIARAAEHADFIRQLPEQVDRAIAEPRISKRREQAKLLRCLLTFYLRFPIVTDQLTVDEIAIALIAMARLEATTRRRRSNERTNRHAR